MELKLFIDKAFEAYEDTAELHDFKEELLTNLQERVDNLIASGTTRNDAMKKIEIEFADVNKIADEMSLSKKKEVFEYQYMSLRHFISKPRAAIYTILAVLTLFGIIIAFQGFFASNKIEAFIGSLFVFLAIPIAGFVYMALTQETATRNPMRPVRASIYGIATFVLLFGALLVPMLIFGEAKSLAAAFGVLIPFALPSIGVLSYLIITEADHRKSWVKKVETAEMEWAKEFQNSGNAAAFGIITAAIWVLAIGAFVLLLLLKLWIYSWIPFVLAFALMMFALAFYMKKK
ncbi:permease prefix domain 1-containing protein [Ornithinibacillus sp. 4-3]|uniref:Permease prefix domain 1-containing protein n=1 Tax=Ornithinibacillus sp. 4-3 TaxID=3231488 RepID=A0AB39HUT4_9BACI